MISNSTVWITAICLAAFLVAVIWLGAPALSALIGTAAAGLLLYFRQRRS